MVCENTSSSLGLNVGQGYYDQRIEPIVVKHETSAWSGPLKRGGPLA